MRSKTTIKEIVMRLALLMSVATLSMSPILSFAGEKCTCSHECMENCKAGKGENCKCKACDCKKTGKCSEGKCHEESKDGK